MNRRTIALTAIIIIAISVASVFLYPYIPKLEEQKPVVQQVDYVERVQGSKYDTTITIYKGTYELAGKEYQSGDFSYIKSGKNYIRCYYDEESRAALNWIKENTSNSAVFLNWWDYGHMIVGVAERETIVIGPSQETLYMVSNPDPNAEFSDHATLVDIANALTTSNEAEAVKIMEKYGADYVYISDADKIRCFWFFNVSGQEPSQYIAQWTKEEVSFTDEGKATMIYKLLFNEESLNNFMLVYQDEYVKIYELKK